MDANDTDFELTHRPVYLFSG